MAKIVSAKPVGKAQTFDLEVDHPDHQFYLANGILTSNSHAVAYAIDSYYCAWLQTYYEPEWCCAYLESVSNNADKLARAIQDVKMLGYKIKKLDINIASHSWTIVDGEKAFVPSFYSCKGIGQAAIDEILENRPYKTASDLIWDGEGNIKHSKFNKKALESLIQIGAFESMDLIGPEKEFSSYRHMHEVLIENLQEMKKSPKKDPGYGQRFFKEVKEALRDIPDWTRLEKITMLKEITGDVGADAIIPQIVLDALAKREVKPIDDHDGETSICWMVVDEVAVKMTKNKKQYLMVKGFGIEPKRVKMFIWGYNPEKHPQISQFDLIVSEIEKGDFGFSTTAWKMRKVELG